MAMSTSALPEGDPVSEINTTPLIDVMLVLLIMLIVTLDPPAHAVRLDTPLPAPIDPLVPPPKPEIITVAVDYNGAYSWNGLSVGSEELDARFRTEAARDPQPEIHILPHRLARYGAVAHVMASAQRNRLTRLGVIGGT